MADVRQELIAEYQNGSETHVGQLCLRAAELIRKIELENFEMRDRLAKVRGLSDVSRI